MLIKGTRIYYVKETQTGTDEFNKPICTEVLEPIDNVLISPANDIASSIPTEEDLTRRKEVLTLGIPKGDTHDWVNCYVILNNVRYKSIGYPVHGIEEMVPTDWHLKVTVERHG